jgi:integrase
MPRKYPKSVRLPKYRHHKPKDRAYIECAGFYDPPRKYLDGSYNSQRSREHYEKECQRIAAWKLAKRPAVVAHPVVLVKELVLRFSDDAVRHYGSDTNSEYLHYRRALKPLRELYGGEPLSAIGPLKLKQVREKMIDKGWCRDHVNSQFNRLRRMFKWAVENEHCTAEQYGAIALIAPERKGKSRAPERPQKMPVKWEVVELVLPFVAPVVSAMLRVGYFTGMRPGEVCAMTKAQMDFSDGDVWWYRPIRHKTQYLDRPKDIPIGPRAQAALQPYLDVADSTHLFSPRIAMLEHWGRRYEQGNGTKVYGKRLAKRLNRDMSKWRERYFTDSLDQALSHGLDRLQASLGEATPIERWHPHQLRHARATLTKEKYGRDGAQAILGNTKEATDIYTAQVLPLARQIAAAEG